MNSQPLPRILHANVFSHLPTGVLNQLKSEYLAVQALGIPWDIAVWCTDTASDPFIRTFPASCDSVPKRRLYFLRWLKQACIDYDIVLFRHPLSDPFLWFFAKHFKIRVSIHHTKEIEECPAQRGGLIGKIATLLERHLGTLAIQRADGIISVTSEIAQYELTRAGQDKPSLVMPNGIDTAQISVCQDQRSTTPRLLFVASHFAAWHGLDLLLDTMEASPDLACVVDIVGQLDEVDQQRIIQTPSLAKRITLHGKLDVSAIQELAHKADAGLSSFAMQRNGLNEGCTLKVREYLAMGLPVYAGHRDAGLPDGYPFYRNSACFLPAIINAVQDWKACARDEVRQSAIPWIEKRELVHKTYSWLMGFYQSQSKNSSSHH